jgi:hypothetical protein
MDRKYPSLHWMNFAMALASWALVIGILWGLLR